jgi:hypothetical protein
MGTGYTQNGLDKIVEQAALKTAVKPNKPLIF